MVLWTSSTYVLECYVTTFCAPRTTCVLGGYTATLVERESECRATHTFTLATALTPLPQRRGLRRESPLQCLRACRLGYEPEPASPSWAQRRGVTVPWSGPTYTCTSTIETMLFVLFKTMVEYTCTYSSTTLVACTVGNCYTCSYHGTYTCTIPTVKMVHTCTYSSTMVHVPWYARVFEIMLHLYVQVYVKWTYVRTMVRIHYTRECNVTTFCTRVMVRGLWWRSALHTSLSSWNRSIPWCLLCWQRPLVQLH